MMRFGLLGPLEVLDDHGVAVDIGGRQPRLVVAMLLAAEGRIVTVDSIVDELWGDAPPPAAAGTLQSYVSRLRRRFQQAAGAGSVAPALVFEDPGYRLEVGYAEVDVRRFLHRADEGRSLLDAGRVDEARGALVAADNLWRGPALLEFRDHEFALGLATRLEERRLLAIEDRIEADLLLGLHAAAAGELGDLVREHPLREGLRAQLALALYRSGRQADALRVIDDARTALREELGVDPGRRLQQLEVAILDHDPALEPAVHPRGSPVVVPTPTAMGVPATEVAAPGVAETEVASPSRGGLIGRDAELAEILSAYAESAHDARIVVIEGEPGIGKTRLAEEALAEAASRGAVVAWGRGYEGGAAPALWPWLSPLRALGERDGVTDASLDALSSTETSGPGDISASVRFERFEAVARLLHRIGATAPVVVVLDDLQWADEASLDLLSFLSVHLVGGVLLVLTMRVLEVGRNDALTEALAAVARRAGSRRIQLRGLSRADTVSLLDALTGRSVGRDVAAAIHARSDGNPFYATELTRLVLGDDQNDAGAVARAAVPAGVGDVIRRRLAQLPEPTRELLAVAAVAGRDVDLGLLARVAGEPIDVVLDRLEPAAVHRLLLDAPDGPVGFRFSHALIREVLVEDLSSLRRARLHLKVADALEQGGVPDDDVEVLAEHLWRAVPVGAGKRAAAALERAAEVAIRRVAFASAEELLQRAVELRRTALASSADPEAELLAIQRLLVVARAQRYFAGASTPELLERAKDLAQQTGRHDVLINVLWSEWSAASTASRIDETDRLVSSFVHVLLDDPDPGISAFGHVVLAIHAWQAGRISDAVDRLERAAEILRAAPEPDLSVEFEGERAIVALAFRHLMHAFAGDDDGAGAALEALADDPDPFVMTEFAGFTTVVGLMTGDWDLVERMGRRVHAIDPDASDFSFWSPHGLMGLAAAMARRGEIDEARDLFDRARKRYVGVGAGSGLACQDAGWAIALAVAGRADEAVAAAERARLTQGSLREGWNEPLVVMAEGLAALAAGDTGTGAERLRAAHRVASQQGAHGVARHVAAVASTHHVHVPADV